MLRKKKKPKFLKVALKVATAVFKWKVVFEYCQKSIYLGYFCKQICHPGFSKVALSGHTARNASFAETEDSARASVTRCWTKKVV